MKQVFVVAVVLAVLSVRPVAEAQGTVPFMTVDAVNVTVGYNYAIVVTGVVPGESTSSTRSITFRPPGVPDYAQVLASLEICHRQLLLALSRPGQYVVQAGLNLCNVALVAP